MTPHHHCACTSQQPTTILNCKPKNTRFIQVPPFHINLDVLLVSTNAFICSYYDNLVMTPANINNHQPVNPTTSHHKIHNIDQTSTLLAKISPAINNNPTAKILHATPTMATTSTMMTPTTLPMTCIDHATYQCSVNQSTS